MRQTIFESLNLNPSYMEMFFLMKKGCINSFSYFNSENQSTQQINLFSNSQVVQNIVLSVLAFT